MMTPKATALSVAILMVIVSAIFINLRYEYIKQRHEIEMSFLLNTAHKNLEQTLTATYNSNLAVALTINDNGVSENFDKVASEIIALNPIIDIIELVPNGVIKYIYPLESNESVMDYDILNTPLIADEAKRAIEKKAVYFAGPFELKQGGLAVAGRYPVYAKKKFWGFSAIIIRFDNLMNSCGMYSNNNPNYFFQFSKTDPKTDQEQFFLSQPTDFNSRIYKKVSIIDGDWNLYIATKANNSLYLSDMLPYVLFCLFLTLFLPYFIYVILKKPQELEIINSIQARRIIQSEAKFQVIFNKTSIAIAQINVDNQEFVEVNPQFCHLLSTETKQIRGKSLLDFMYTEDIQNFSDFIHSSRIIVKEKKHINIRLKNSKNELIWTRIVPSPLIDDNQNSKSIILAIENISERKIAQEKLIQSELQFKSLFQESPIPLWEEDGSCIKDYFEKLDLIGKSRDYVQGFFESNPAVLFEIISKVKVINVNEECLNLYGAKDKYELIQIYSQSMKLSSTKAYMDILIDLSQGLKKGCTQTKILFPNGREVIIAMAWNIVAGYEESFSRFIISTQDVTASITAQQLIASSEQKLQSIINSIDGIVWEYDMNMSKFKFISKQAETILGYKTEDWCSIENFWEDHIYIEDRKGAVEFCEANLKTSNSFSFEYRMIAANGALVWFRDIVNVHNQANGNRILRGIMIDVTLLKENESDLKQSLEMVTEQNKRLLNFSYIVSHNLRSHTSNIQSLATLIKESDNIIEQQKLIQLVGTVSNELNDTIINLNEVINIRKDVNLNVQNLRLVEFVLKTLDVISEDLRIKNIRIIGKIPPSAIVNYNRAYLQSVLINVISNAIRYSKKADDGRFIKFTYYEQQPYSILEIEDNGIGINMHRHKNKIFGLYKTFTNNKDAKGVGLFLTKNQVEAMSGKIEIVSELNKGTIVRIYFKN